MTDKPQPSINSLREVRPDDGSPSCHVCGTTLQPDWLNCPKCEGSARSSSCTGCEKGLPLTTHERWPSRDVHVDSSLDPPRYYSHHVPTGPAPSVVDSRPRKFRKKPVVIEAMQIDGTYDANQIVLDWVNANTPGFDKRDSNTWRIAAYYGDLKISTLEGEMTAQKGDWIIRGVKGEFYPCKPGIFEATYEAAE